jgi:hypothetical protein
MPSLQNSELLPKCEVFQNEIPTALKSADECPEPEEKHVEHGPELYQIVAGDRPKPLILRSARVLARDRGFEALLLRTAQTINNNPTHKNASLVSNCFPTEWSQALRIVDFLLDNAAHEI